MTSQVQSPSNVSAGVVTMTNVSVSDTVQPGFEVENKLVTDMAVKLKQCSFINVATAPSLRWGGTNIPMLLHQSSVGDVGGFTFEECVVVDTVKRPFLSCDSCETRGAAADVSGSIAVSNPHGCTTLLGDNAKNVTLDVTCNKNATTPKGPPIGMVLPLYVDPGPVWQRLALSAMAHPHDVEITAIISPRHGDNNADMAGDDIPKYLAFVTFSPICFTLTRKDFDGLVLPP